MAFFRLTRTLQGNRVLHNSVRFQNGYVVLWVLFNLKNGAEISVLRPFRRLPEIGEDAPDKNPLYHSDGLPKFSEITIENCRSAMAKQTLDFEVGVQEIENKLTDQPCQDAIKDIIEPLERLGNPMETTWGLSKALYLGNNTLMPTSSYMAIHDRARRARASKYTSKPIHFAIKEDFTKEKERTVEETRILEKYILEGKLNGLELEGRKADKFSYDFNKLVQEKKQFKFKTELATKQHSQLISDSRVVQDFPEDLLKVSSFSINFIFVIFMFYIIHSNQEK